MTQSVPSGFICIDKPAGISSFACIYSLKKLIGKGYRIGHAGTLDPFATGLLIVAIGRSATKELSLFAHAHKDYLATGLLGTATDTLDSTGTITLTSGIPTHNDLSAAIDNFGTTYLQTPPYYSALKYKGQPLYALARTKKLHEEELLAIVEKKQKTITIHALSLTSYAAPYFSIYASVSHGTYIRSLMHDIGKVAGSCATTTALRRSRIGPLTVAQAFTPSEFVSTDFIVENLMSVQEMQELMLDYSTSGRLHNPPLSL
jgi:tRNA pseudouridine55 synthase